VRLDLLRALIVAGDGGMAQGSIARHLKVSASRLSFHLSALEQAGLVAARRDGRNVIYAANHAVIGGVIGFLLHDCCGGHPKICACSQRGTGPTMHHDTTLVTP
jgi:ArsR family transcriptional regulator, arsenate/arsenite/antimonite-responsive transcriptional repressor